MVAIGIQEKEGLTAQKLDMLRRAMRAKQLDAYLIPSTDEHLNEYLPENKQRRAWVSGFTGSAGDFLLTQDDAWLFVDSRYHEQADYEVAERLIHISKLGLEEQPTLNETVKRLAEASPSFRLGIDPFSVSLQQAQSLQKVLGKEAELVPVSENLVDGIWVDRPDEPTEPVFALPASVTGKSLSEKLETIRQKMKALQVDVLPVTKLDQIAWLFNLRGQDIPYNPVFVSYAIVTTDQALLLTETSRILPEALKALQPQVEILPYATYADTLKVLANGQTVLVDPKHSTFGTYHLVKAADGHIQEAEHPVELLKALKNETEIRGMQAANLKASRAKIRAWHWLEQQLRSGKTVTEASFRDAIEDLYSQEADFKGLSFNTIAGAGSNSSIVHYGTSDPQKTLEPGELFLIDSGCQFCGDTCGTTDDTRTVLVGELATDLQKLRFTEVLKAHINCAMQRFPKGTEGARLDGITRATLWQNGLDYGHGTGHGVGAFLNVHEGPNGIHKAASRAFEPGMITSIEPGYYEPGWGGIRLENLYQVVDLGSGQYGFESLTYIPFDPRLIDKSRLNAEQLAWLHGYYEAILGRIGPTLPQGEADWLREICTL